MLFEHSRWSSLDWSSGSSLFSPCAAIFTLPWRHPIAQWFWIWGEALAPLLSTTVPVVFDSCTIIQSVFRSEREFSTMSQGYQSVNIALLRLSSFAIDYPCIDVNSFSGDTLSFSRSCFQQKRKNAVLLILVPEIGTNKCISELLIEQPWQFSFIREIESLFVLFEKSSNTWQTQVPMRTDL